MKRVHGYRRKKKENKIWIHVLVAGIGFVMIYPLLWLLASAFKRNDEIFKSIDLIPTVYNFQAFRDGWKAVGDYTFATFFKNSFLIVVPVVIFTVISVLLVAYGFARFRFPLKKVFFMMMISTMIVPASVLTIPTYVMFRSFGWIDTYYPLIVPSLFATKGFFVFMMIQFFRGIPKEIDEAAKIDGCNSLQILVQILTPLCKPAIFSVIIFRFMWTWNDFFTDLIYINSVRKYPVSLGLRMAVDNTAGTVAWNNIMAMSVISILPPLILYFVAQDYFVEGIATSGLKG